MLQGIFVLMFVRRNKNRSGTYSIQIIQKVGRRNRIVKTLGSSGDANELEHLERQAKLEIEKLKRQQSLFTSTRDTDLRTALSTVSNDEIELVGPELILGSLYESMGYGEIENDGLFRDLVISRLVYPGSKLKTVDYLGRYRNKEISVYSVYRYMDKLHSEYKAKVEQVTFGHFKKVLGGQFGIVFYDMTTLYFETPDEDDIRRIGYSKDGKHQHPQIKLGVLVGPDGFPIGYDIFEGNLYEGHTLIPILEKLQEKFSIGKPIVIADAGLLTNKNIKGLITKGYEFVLGGRIKNEQQEIKEKIQELEIEESHPKEITKDDYRLIVSYSSKRASKDEFNRRRGLKKLEAKIKKGKLDKDSINNRGYNKYLKLESEVKVSIDYEKFENDKKWDGLKGYLTNTRLKPKEVIDAYANLWHIEKAFRISKTDIRIRPIYHRMPHRIESHICICFVAYAVFKELERKLKEKKIHLSPYRAIELTKNMYQIRIQYPDSKVREVIPLKLTSEQQLLARLLG